MRGYGQFCPVAKACELLAERWTLVIVRELVSGGKRFNDIRRGVPLISPTLLSKRLEEMTSAGVIRRVKGKRGAEYELTAAGEELRPIVELIGRLGSEVGAEQVRRGRSRRQPADVGFAANGRSDALSAGPLGGELPLQ